MVYSFDSDTGGLQEETAVETRPGAGPRALAVHPGGKLILVVNELDSSLDAWILPGGDGILELVSSIGTQVYRHDSTGLAAAVQLDDPGWFAFVSNRGADTVATFAIDPSGALVAHGEASAGGEWPRSIALTPDERFLLVANERSHLVSLLPLDDDGSVGPSVADIAIERPACIAFG